MNRKKVRRLLDSVADQLTSETDALIATLNELKAEHQEKVDRAVKAAAPGHRSIEFIEAAGWHNRMIHTINLALRHVQA